MAKQDGIKRRKRYQSDKVKMRIRAQEKKTHQRWYRHPTLDEAKEQNRLAREGQTRHVMVAHPKGDELEDFWDRFYAGRI